MLTFTFSSPFRVEDGDNSFDETMRLIMQQADSLVYHMRTLGKSEVFKSKDIEKECAYKKRLHYEWALELQATANVHLHATISLPNNVNEVIAFIELIHSMRNRHLEMKVTSRDRKNQSVMPLGRTHLALPAAMKAAILEHFRQCGVPYKMMPDKADASRKAYFFPMLSPEINIYEGNGTLLEFISMEDMLANSKRLKKYIQSLPKGKFKLKTILAAMDTDTRRHNLKGKFNDSEEDVVRELEDIAVFEYLKIKMYSYTQMTFPTTLYQKVRKQLITYDKRYESLATVTVDWCEGIIAITGKEPNRRITVYGEVAAKEPKREKIQIDYASIDESNPYQRAKEGI